MRVFAHWMIEAERASASAQSRLFPVRSANATSMKILAVSLPPQPHDPFCQFETCAGPSHESKHGNSTTIGRHTGRSAVNSQLCSSSLRSQVRRRSDNFCAFAAFDDILLTRGPLPSDIARQVVPRQMMKRVGPAGSDTKSLRPGCPSATCTLHCHPAPSLT